MHDQGTSPASKGPAGPLFESEVGAYYLLSLLLGGEPRGFPGAKIRSVQFQRGDEGHPLDDIVVVCDALDGRDGCLELQVKRTLRFTASEPQFANVIAQLVAASRKPEFQRGGYELAVAVARTSGVPIDDYMDVLLWSRKIEDPTTFFARLSRVGIANKNMRAFIKAIRSQVEESDGAWTDEALFSLLRHFQILTFDFGLSGWNQEMALERCRLALAPEARAQASLLWDTLINEAQTLAAVGGDTSREPLMKRLRAKSLAFAADPRVREAQLFLREMSTSTLAAIDEQIGQVTLGRAETVAAAREALGRGRYVEIRGDSGVGKSGILRRLAEMCALEGAIVVLGPNRTPPGGWSAMRSQMGFMGTHSELFAELARGGKGTLFIDNLDDFNSAEQTTVFDLFRSAADCEAFSVVTTARADSGPLEDHWFHRKTPTKLGSAQALLVTALRPEEVEEIRTELPELFSLMAETHPARDLARNLFRLSRLVSSTARIEAPRTEVEMAVQWWQSTNGLEGRFGRQLVLRRLALEVFQGRNSLEVTAPESSTVQHLIADKTLRAIQLPRITFHHDVLRDWAVAAVLYDDPTVLRTLRRHERMPPPLARGVELFGRMLLEKNSTSDRWMEQVDELRAPETHVSWRHVLILAIARSETGLVLLERSRDHLLKDGARLLSELVRLVVSREVQPAAQVYRKAGIAIPEKLGDFAVPVGASWHSLIQWCLENEESNLRSLRPTVSALYLGWCLSPMFLHPLTPAVIERLFSWLPETAGKRESRTERSVAAEIRNGFLICCRRTPELAVKYLAAVEAPRDSEVTRDLLSFAGSLPEAAPEQFAKFIAKVLIRTEDPREDPSWGPFELLEHQFAPPSPTRGPFLALLKHAPEHGLWLVRRLAELGLTRFRGHLMKGGYDAKYGQANRCEADAPAVS